MEQDMRSDRLPILICLLLTFIFLSLTCLFGQSPDDATSDTNKSWTATSEQRLPGTTTPTRTTQSHTKSNGRTIDKQTIERIGLDGKYVPYLDTEKESVKVDATTVRTIERTFVRNPDGQKTLFQVTEEEERSLPGGEVNVVRTTSDPDVNGRLQVVQREIQNTKPTSPDAQEMKTTVLTPDLNGGLVPSKQVQETEIKRGDHLVEFRKSTLVPDGNGNLQLSEVRQGITRGDGKERTKEESVLRLGSDGKLATVGRTVSKESQTAPGEKRDTVETYSSDLAGISESGSLAFNQRVTTIHRVQPDGRQVTEKQVEQRNPAAPSDGPRVTQRAIDIVRPGSGGATQETQTIQILDTSHNWEVVSIDTRKADNSAIQVDIAAPDKPK